MSIELTCPACGVVNAFLEDHCGSMGKCGRCQTPLYIPRLEEMPAAIAIKAPKRGPAKGLIVAAVVGLLLAGSGLAAYVVFSPKPVVPEESPAPEVKDLFASAQVVKPASSAATVQEGDLADAKSESMFKFKAPSTGTMMVFIDPADGGKLAGHLFAFDAQRKDLTQNDADLDKRISQVLFPVTGDQEYYVKVAGFDASAGKYKLTFTHVTDVPGNFENALEVRLTRTGSATQSWRIDAVGDEDRFRLVAPVSGWMTVEMNNNPGNLDGTLNVYDSSRQVVRQYSDAPRRVRYAVEAGKTYYVKVAAWTRPLAGMSATGPYTLNFRTDKADKDDHGNDFNTASEIFPNAFATTTSNGRIDTPADVDFFRFQAPQTGTMIVELLNTGNLSAFGFAYDRSRISVGQGGGTQLLTIPVTSGSTYYVEVMPRNPPLAGMQQTGSYALNFRMETKPFTKIGNDFSKAQLVFLDANGNADVSGQLNFGAEANYYRFLAPSTNRFTVELKNNLGSNLAATLSAFDGGYVPVGQGAGSRFLNLSVFAGSAYYVKVIPSAFPPQGMQKTGSYTLVFRNDKVSVAKGQESFTLRGHTDAIQGVAFSPDGTRLASASWDRTVKIWGLATGLETQTLRGHTGNVHSVAFDPNGKRVVSGSQDGTARVWDLTTGQTLLTLARHTAAVWNVDFSPDGTRVATGSWDRTVKVWDLATGQDVFTLQGHTNNVNAVTFDLGGKRLASGSSDRSVRVWDLATGQNLLTLQAPANVTGVAFSSDGKRLAAATDQTVTIWDVTTGEQVFVLRGHTGSVEKVAFSRKSKYLVSGAVDKTLKVWDVTTGKEVRTFYGHTDGVWGVAFSPDGKRVASGASDRTVKIWDLPQALYPVALRIRDDDPAFAKADEKAQWDGVPVRLDPKLNPGDVFYVQNTVDQKMTMKILGQTTDVTTKYKRLDRYEVQKIFPHVVLGITTQELSMAATPPLDIEPILSRAKGARFTLTAELGKKVADFQGYEDFVQRLSQGDLALADKVRRSIARESLQLGMEGIFLGLPEYAVRPGDQWTSKSEMPLGTIGKLNIATVLTYQGTRQGLDVISSVATSTFVANAGGALGPAKITQAQFSSNTSKGTVLFDRARGRLVSAKAPQTIEGSLTISLGGETSQMTLSMTQTANCRVMDTPPGKFD